MCIAVWTLDHPDYALILGNNRDEYLNRPTTDAHFHNFESNAEAARSTPGHVLSGRDERAGGTWFGINRAGRVALLTNITEPPKEFSSSRGYLVSSFLLSDSSHPLEDEVGKIIPRDAQFAGFNLLLLAPASQQRNEPLAFDAALITNHGSGGTLTSRPLSAAERRCGGVSNGIDGQGATEWPKVKHITHDFANVLHNLTPGMTESEIADRVFQVLAWRSPEAITERSHLRKTVHVAPLPITMGALPNPIADCYATRLSTVLLIRRNGQVLFIERDIWKTLKDGQVVRANSKSERRFSFQLQLGERK
ncbi:hypothetical protein AX16_004564 [Volvariella volvacea WC 439]|nr:hypothetical protein AX16_004564 [Volvariella volvacea WC 439]